MNAYRRAPVVLSLRAITRRFDALLANDAIDLDLKAGEMLALVGENGAGKTTLIDILIGTAWPTKAACWRRGPTARSGVMI